jgi:hypothetical protein
MTPNKWKETQYGDSPDSPGFCKRCNRPLKFHRPDIPALCPFVPMFDDPNWDKQGTDNE